MVTAMIYDTLKLAEQLEHEAGFEAARAKAMARILAENAGGNLVTREDLLVTKGELQTTIQTVRDEIQGVRNEFQGVRDEIQGVRNEIQGVRSDLDTKIGDLRSDLDSKTGALQGDVRVLYWMTGTTLAGVATLLGIAITIALHLIHLG